MRSQQRLETFNLYQNIHFIGIGGIGISALARILAKEGHFVTGSDLNQTKNSDLLITEGIDVKIGHNSSNIPEKCDLVIYTTAVNTDSNCEFLEAKKRSLKTLSYPQAIGLLTENYRTICVCGTHGKTTTTALLGLMLYNNKLDPTVIVGSLVREFGQTNELLGNSDILVLESCEYQEAFLNYTPSIIILNNIDPEHLDYYGSAEAYLHAFEKFLAKLSPSGLLVANGDDPNVRLLINKHNFKYSVITFGQAESNDIVFNHEKIIFEKKAYPMSLSIPGIHNRYNLAAALTVSNYLKVPIEKALCSIENFRGADRRFEIKGKIGNTTVIDDYGHAPAEVQATLLAAREKFGKKAKILVVFQPHQYSRTFFFLKEFGQSFGLCDRVYIPNIYRSRDSDDDVSRVSVDNLVNSINTNNSNLAHNTENFDSTLARIKTEFHDYDLIITLGAGDITKLSDEIINIV